MSLASGEWGVRVSALFVTVGKQGHSMFTMVYSNVHTVQKMDLFLRPI
jgi:hypothetical protein